MNFIAYFKYLCLLMDQMSHHPRPHLPWNPIRYTTLVSKPTPVKLDGARNYRSWAKGMEMVILRVKAWTLVTQEPPAVADRTEAWLEKDIWARSEIHLWSSPDQQDLIHDTTTAYESWKILKDQYSTKSDLMTVRLTKEFASANMTSTESCTDYVRRIKRMVSEFRDCGTSIKQQDVAYTILMGLPREFSALVITLTNMSTPESPLVQCFLKDVSCYCWRYASSTCICASSDILYRCIRQWLHPAWALLTLQKT